MASCDRYLAPTPSGDGYLHSATAPITQRLLHHPRETVAIARTHLASPRRHNDARFTVQR